MENKIAHLNMIRAIIARLASNSYLLKGWSITVVSAMLALAAKDGTPKLVALALFPAVVFWGLDGYFVWKEGCFRVRYDEVRVLSAEGVDFAMTLPAGTSAPDWLGKTFSRTLLFFHGVIVVLILAVALMIHTQ